MKQEISLQWGDPYIVRQALTETLGVCYPIFAPQYRDMAYPPHTGSPKLIELLKEQVKRQSGHKPKHLIVTCGATGAINAALYALKTQKTDWVVANKRHFPLYPAFISMADMIMIDKNKKDELINKFNGCVETNFISLIDSPSNPEGWVNPFEHADIWDGAYATKTYSKGGHTPKKFRVFCGSLSKTLGLAGLRLGWVSTDEDLLIHSLERYVTAQTAGPSTVSMSIAEEVLGILDQDKFETRAAGYLDQNREEMQKVLTKFGQGEIPVRGMFALLGLGKAEKKALERAKIKYLPGNMWGETDDWARLSLGQTREIIRAAVKAILK